MIETSQLITLAVCCGYVSNLIGRRTINIPEIMLGVHGLTGFTVKTKREITKESSLRAIYNENSIYKITKGRVTKFTKAKINLNMLQQYDLSLQKVIYINN